jgi:hypothetical protein
MQETITDPARPRSLHRRQPPDARPGNLLDRIDDLLREVTYNNLYSVSLIHRPVDMGDAIVAIPAIADMSSEADTARRILDGSEDIASVSREGRSLLIAFSDTCLAELGGALEAGERTVLGTQDLLAGAPYIVDFCDPSPATALHAGYLRNIALGHALASALLAAGAHVARQTQIADVGRDIGEAIAGYVRHAAEADPASAGEKSDHFVARRRALYAYRPHTDTVPAGGAAAPAEALTPSLEDPQSLRYVEQRGDLADELLARLASGEREACDLWQTVRNWAVSGQNETLTRLGVRFDRTIFDSQYVPRIEPLLRLALAQGVVSKSTGDATALGTGPNGDAYLPLIDGHGAPTRDLRALTIWRSLMTEMTDITLIRLSSEERRDHLDEILRKLAPGAPVYPTAVLHGEVLTDQGIVDTRGDTTLLIDDLLDMLMAHEDLRRLALEERPSCGVEDLAALVLMGMCLDHPLRDPLILTPERVLEKDANIGWTLAEAWMKAWDPANDGQPRPEPEDRSYRFLTAQSQLYRPLLAHATECLDVRELVRFLVRVGRWYLDTPTGPSVGRVMRSLLCSGLTGAGLVRAPEVNK